MRAGMETGLPKMEYEWGKCVVDEEQWEWWLKPIWLGCLLSLVRVRRDIKAADLLIVRLGGAQKILRLTQINYIKSGPIVIMIRSIFRHSIASGKKYVLSQFPYPSGELHLGHARVYYIGDTLARYYRKQGQHVIYPIGWDSFGLPAENAAILHGKDPLQWTEGNIAQMKKQLQCLEIEFNWEREISTSRAEYYRWTQQIFTRMFRQGLAYRDFCQVNWDPVDKTVLANEQVDKQGRSWRSGAVVEKKMLEQWFLRISRYAQQLQESLRDLNWIERVKAMQAGWIGHQNGHFLTLPLTVTQENNLNLETINAKCTGKGIKLQKDLKMFIQDLQMLSLGEGECFIRVNITEKDSEGDYFGQKLEIGQCVNPITGKTIKVYSGNQQNGTYAELVLAAGKDTLKDGMQPIGRRISMQSIGKLNKIERTVVMKIRDWSVSRQRYWGTPIPIVYCQKCGVVPVPDEHLPVVLPKWSGNGNPLLLDQFRNCQCPSCKGNARRETDTMDTFVDSSWYYLRFLDPLNANTLCSKDEADKMMPVDIYIGGIEHAIMHLLYARFFMRFLADEGVCSIREPFKELVVQGLVKGKTLKHIESGKYLRPSQVAQYKPQQIEQTYEKMSKSKFNGLNPTELVDLHGPDELRIALFFAAPPEHDVDFNLEMLVSAGRFLRRVQQIFAMVKSPNNNQNLASIQTLNKQEGELSYRLKNIIQKLQQAAQKRLMHVYVANSMELFNQAKSYIHQNPNKVQTIQIVAYRILLPVLEIIAPKLIKAIRLAHFTQDINFEWPASPQFSNQMQCLVMKGNKMFKKGRIVYSQGMEEWEIMREMGVEWDKSCIVKRNKKNIVIIMK